jgi:hypothetical protein
MIIFIVLQHGLDRCGQRFLEEEMLRIITGPPPD